MYTSCKFCRIRKQRLIISRNYDESIIRKKIYSNNRYNSDLNFHLIHITRCRTRHALNSKVKFSPTKDILGIDIDTFRE